MNSLLPLPGFKDSSVVNIRITLLAVQAYNTKSPGYQNRYRYPISLWVQWIKRLRPKTANRICSSVLIPLLYKPFHPCLPAHLGGEEVWQIQELP